MQFCYVVLHYKNNKDTEKCIESLIHTTSELSRIIIVDNGSNDGSGEKLEKKYHSNRQCEFILLRKNLGFSKGNNAGYLLAKQKYNPDFIVITNNDVVFYQNNFEDNVREIFVRTKFDVLGPDIYIPRHGDHQSPLFKTAISIDELRNELAEYRYYLDHPSRFSKRLKIHAIKNRLCSHSAFIRFIYSKIRKKDNMDYKKEYEAVGLQGACLIFSKKFIQKENKAFEPEPFLYEEEVFLFFRCRKKGYKMIYSPKVAIKHEEAASFKNANRDNNERLKYMLKHHVTSREMLLDYIENSVEDRIA